jgi:hypothetical protein
MIEVIIDSPTVVQASNVDSNLYYGILRKEDKSKGFITRELYNQGKHIVSIIYELTNGNGPRIEDNVDYSDLSSVINNLITGHSEVFEFDTPKQLMKWLAE